MTKCCGTCKHWHPDKNLSNGSPYCGKCDNGYPKIKEWHGIPVCEFKTRNENRNCKGWEENETMRREEFPIVDKIREEAYQQGKADGKAELIERLKQYRFGNRGGLVHWEDINRLKEQK